MGYQISSTKKRRDGSYGWDLKWQKDFGNGKREWRHVSKKSIEFRELGFQGEMTIEEARARAKQLAAERQLQLYTERIAKIEKKLKLSRLIKSAFLPKEPVIISLRLLSTPAIGSMVTILNDPLLKSIGFVR